MKHALAAVFVLMAAACPAHAALVVSQAPTSNVACVSGVCTATAADAVLNLKDLKHLLNAGDVSIVSGSAAMDIDFDTKLQWTKPHSLTLDAYRGIEIDLDITSEGPGGVTLTTNDGGSGGDLVFTGKGKVSFWSTANSLVINGTPYTLVDSIQMLASAIAANPNGFYALSMFYDASADGTYASDPVPTAFGGTFEGLGHVIENVTISTADRGSGFFANVIAGGAVRDLAFDAASLTGVQPYGVVAAVNRGTLSRVTADVAIQSPVGNQGGGLVGVNAGTIAWCATSGSIFADSRRSRAGGLVGVNQGAILHSRSSASVQARAAGGLVYLNDQGGSISSSSATGEVQAYFFEGRSGYAAGGLVETNLGTIDQSFSSGAVSAGEEAQAGGFTAANMGTITNSYSTGAAAVAKHGSVGGFAAFSQGLLDTSYSTGIATMYVKVESGFVETLAGSANDYWDTDTSGTTTGCRKNCTGVTGLTTAQLQSGLPAGFDPAIWAESPGINNGLPYLIANPPQ
jgi:hypothetical protein